MHADKANIAKAYVRRESPTPNEFTSDEQECLQSLYFTEMHWRKNDVADPAPATCAWLVQHRTYRQWLDKGHGLLWIKGNPGTGKSTVLKHALEIVEQFAKQKSILASFFFHGRGAPLQKSTLGLFRSLLHQILQQNRVLLSKFTRLYKTRCKTDGEFGKTWEWQANELQPFFKSNVVDAARTQQIRVYIDALDECGKAAAIDLVEFFRCFEAPVSICFSCRHYPFVALEGGDEICVEDENGQDVEIYVQEKIEAHVHRTGIAKILRNEVVSRSQGNFQWVVLVIMRVITLYKSRESLATIKAMIQNTPTELHEVYAGILGPIDDQERAQCLHFMQWMYFSFRPLTVKELRVALAINPDISHTSIHQGQNSEFYVDRYKDMKQAIANLSRGLAEVKQQHNRQEPTVQFIHQSVPDFLHEDGFQVLNSSIAGNIMGYGHLWLSRSCIEYLFRERFQGPAKDSAIDIRHNPRLARRKMYNSFGLFEYCSEHWFSHIRMVENANIPQDHLAALSTKASVKYSVNCLFYRYISNTTLLITLTQRNFINIGRAVLTRTVRTNQTDAFGQTSLSIAAKRGHAILLESLLGQDDVDVNQKNPQGDTPLSSAARHGHGVVVKLLLSREDVDVNCKNTFRDTPLSLATTNGYEAVVELLLNREDVDLNSVNRNGDTPLSKAIRSGHNAIVRTLLVKKDVDVNHKNLQGNTPLYLAAYYNGPTAVVEVLLQRNANPNIRGRFGWTPLDLAAFYGHYNVVELLLQHNADIDVRDTFGATPLSRAASEGECEVVKLLLRRISNADSIDEIGRTPLSYACAGGYKETVKELLKRSDVDVNSRENDGRSVLYWAIEGFFTSSTDFENAKDIVDLLLSRHDILINKADEEALKKFQSKKRRRDAELLLRARTSGRRG